MVKTPLVEPSVEFGQEVLRELDAARFPYSVAFWLKRDSEWTLIIGTPLYDKKGPQEAYLRLLEVLSSDGPVVLAELPIRLAGLQSPLIKSLRKSFGKAKSVEGMRFSGHAIGGEWVDDAYVYRIK